MEITKKKAIKITDKDILQLKLHEKLDIITTEKEKVKNKEVLQEVENYLERYETSEGILYFIFL